MKKKKSMLKLRTYKIATLRQLQIIKGAGQDTATVDTSAASQTSKTDTTNSPLSQARNACTNFNGGDGN